MNLELLLIKNFKPIMKAYYKKKYKNEIYKVLRFYMDYEAAGGINYNELIKIMTLDNDKWSLDKSIKIFGICIYCGLIEFVD